MTAHHLVVIGLDEIVITKYLVCVQEAVAAGSIDGYSVIDLESERAAVQSRLDGAAVRPHRVHYLPDAREQASWEESVHFVGILSRLAEEKGPLKVYIATEARAHEVYLRYCIEHHLDSLVEKPVIVPLTDGTFDPDRVDSVMQSLVAGAERSTASHSVMTLSRYHDVYNAAMLAPLQARMLEWSAPMTSFHLRAAGGVWNLHAEYLQREDHAYKYGYGMLMHGAYHYVDLAAQFLSLNKLLAPASAFSLSVSSFGAYPNDQRCRIPNSFARLFDDDGPQALSAIDGRTGFGETDITSTFRVEDVASGRSVTLGTLSFEQTTPSIRAWKDMPPGLYNKNGRTSSVQVEAQLSTLHSVSVHCYDVPSKDGGADRVDAYAQMLRRTNAALLPGEEYVAIDEFAGLFHSDSNRRLMQHWLAGDERRSTLASHVVPMRIIGALAMSLRTPGVAVTVPL